MFLAGAAIGAAVGLFGSDHKTEVENIDNFLSESECKQDSSETADTNVSISATQAIGNCTYEAKFVAWPYPIKTCSEADKDRAFASIPAGYKVLEPVVKMCEQVMDLNIDVTTDLAASVDQACVKAINKTTEQDARAEASGFVMSDAVSKNKRDTKLRSRTVMTHSLLNTINASMKLSQTIGDVNYASDFTVHPCGGKPVQPQIKVLNMGNQVMTARSDISNTVNATIKQNADEKITDDAYQLARAINKGLDPLGALTELMETAIICCAVVATTSMVVGGAGTLMVYGNDLKQLSPVHIVKSMLKHNKPYYGYISLAVAVFFLLYNVFVWPGVNYFSMRWWFSMWLFDTSNQSNFSLGAVALWGVIGVVLSYHVPRYWMKEPEIPSAESIPSALPFQPTIATPSAPQVQPTMAIPSAPPVPPDYSQLK